MTGILAPSRRLLPARRLGAPPPNATVVGRLDLSPTMTRFTIAPDDGVPPFVPGQYFAIGLELDGRLVQRPYSAASEAGEAALEFAVRLVTDGALTRALWQLRPGDRVRVGSPKGLFRLADGDTRTHLLLATGTGIAPLVAMARSLRERRASPPTVIVHGASRADELAFATELAGWADATARWTYVPAISRPLDSVNAGWAGAVGRLDSLVPSLLRERDLDPGHCVAYLCGNPAMIAGLTAELLGLRVPVQAIHAEAY